MALQSSGAISIGNINTEFGFASTTQRSMSQLYRNGGIVGAGAPNVPTSGAISLSQFYNAANLFNLVISTNQTNANLATLATAAGWDGSAPLIATIASGVYCSSNSSGTPALTVSGSFPGGVELTNNGFIVGMGGAGGNAGPVPASNNTFITGQTGGAGAIALSASSPITVTNNGTIAGGGGGGGGAPGRRTILGGAGTAPGGGGGRSSLAANSTGGVGSGGGATGGQGTVSAAGAMGTWPGSTLRAGDGADWGAAGGIGANYNFVFDQNENLVLTTPANNVASGGAGGAAVSGNANVTWLVTGTRLGALA